MRQTNMEVREMGEPNMEVQEIGEPNTEDTGNGGT